MAIMAADAAIISGFFALTIGLIKLATLAINKIRGRNSDGSEQVEDEEFSSEDRRMLKNLWELNNVKDSDGIPLVYVPRSYNEQHEKIIDALTQISKSQERTAYILEQIANGLSKMLYDRVNPTVQPAAA